MYTNYKVNGGRWPRGSWQKNMLKGELLESVQRSTIIGLGHNLI